MTTPAPALAPTLTYFSDVLCIWAYAAQARLDEVIAQFGEQIRVEQHFCSVFGDAHTKVETAWKDKGSYGGFNAHLIRVAERFDHIKLNDRIWLDVRPRTSTAPHVFLKAVQLVEEEAGRGPGAGAAAGEAKLNDATWQIRRAFFEEARDISSWDVHREIAESLELDFEQIAAKIKSSEAVARLDADHKLAREMAVEGSPTFVMNEGRQKLYGNVGYHLIKANVEELLRKPNSEEASWC